MLSPACHGKLTVSLLFLVAPALRIGGSRTAIQSHGRQSKEKESAMKKPARIEVVRRAYELWEKAGKPEGRDQEFYHQAERELERESEDPETPEDI
jgi:hypothetical protein